MGMNITQIPCNPGDYTARRSSAIRYLVVHYTGAPGTARNCPQRERFTHISDYDKWKPCGKSIIQPSKVKAMGTHFLCGIIGQYKIVDSSHYRLLR